MMKIRHFPILALCLSGMALLADIPPSGCSGSNTRSRPIPETSEPTEPAATAPDAAPAESPAPANP